jgi:hypothetical protein
MRYCATTLAGVHPRSHPTYGKWALPVAASQARRMWEGKCHGVRRGGDSKAPVRCSLGKIMVRDRMANIAL